MVLPRSGSSASSSAPASGTKTMRVRMVWSIFIVSSCARPQRAAKNHHGEDGSGANRQPSRVGANIARNLLAGEPGETSRPHACRPGRTVDHSAIKDKFQDSASEHQQRQHQKVAVELIYPILIGEQRVDGLVPICECRDRKSTRLN